jgi:hypothetical protein
MIRPNITNEKSTPMSFYKSASPAGSYCITLPANICEDKDERVTSYWVPDSEVLLQLSSYSRFEGQQVCAHDRLEARLAQEQLSDVRKEDILIPSSPDCAAISGSDDEGCRWFCCYAVWPELTILATISGRPDELTKSGAWAFESLKSISRTS